MSIRIRKILWVTKIFLKSRFICIRGQACEPVRNWKYCIVTKYNFLVMSAFFPDFPCVKEGGLGVMHEQLVNWTSILGTFSSEHLYRIVVTLKMLNFSARNVNLLFICWIYTNLQIVDGVPNDSCNVTKPKLQICEGSDTYVPYYPDGYGPHLSTAVAWREKKFKHFVFYKYFSLVLGLLKSKISEKFGEGPLNKLDFKLFHYKAMVQPVSKITTIATRNRCWM